MLVRLARQKLGASSRRVADEEDIVVTAFNSFFQGVQAGRFPKLEDRDDLWHVLVMLTARKAVNQLKHQMRQKRGEGRQQGESMFLSPDGEMMGIDQIVGSEPSAEFAGQVTEECAALLDRLDDDVLRRIALAKLEGYSNREIATELGVQRRTVERKLRIIRELWSDAKNE